jgi:uncharacterized damage-inducible protein DinB
MPISLQSQTDQNRETCRIADQLRRAFKGPAWHGPSLKAILLDVSEDRAALQPPNGAHSIWEIVLHITAWMRIARERLAATAPHHVSDEEDWPRPNRSWKDTLDLLAAEEEALYEAIQNFPDDRLNNSAPATEPQTYYILLHGVVQHTLYHAGQIILLNK